MLLYREQYDPVLGYIRPLDTFGDNAALEKVEGHIDDDVFRQKIARAHIDFINSQVDCTGQEKRLYDIQSNANCICHALVVAASIAPENDQDMGSEIATMMENMLFVKLEPESLQADCEGFFQTWYLQKVQDSIETPQQHRNQSVDQLREQDKQKHLREYSTLRYYRHSDSFTRPSDATTVILDQTFANSKTASVLKAYTPLDTSREEKREKAKLVLGS